MSKVNEKKKIDNQATQTIQVDQKRPLPTDELKANTHLDNIRNIVNDPMLRSQLSISSDKNPTSYKLLRQALLGICKEISEAENNLSQE